MNHDEISKRLDGPPRNRAVGLGSRIAQLIESPRAFTFCIGFVTGSYFTLAAAWVWSFYL